MKPTHPVSLSLFFAGIMVAMPLVSTTAQQQALNRIDRESNRAMLKDALEAVKKHYYDPKFRGLDIDKVYAQYDEKMKASQSNHQAFAVIAGFLENLKDSHTFFIPPSRVGKTDYGYEMEMIGNDCFVTRVRPGSDAAAKIHPGDQILQREGFAVNRGDISDILYYFNTLAPVEQSNLQVQDPDGQARAAAAKTNIQMGRKIEDLTTDMGYWEMVRKEETQDILMRDRTQEVGDVMIWKMQWFFSDNATVDGIFGMAQKHQALILDLRGNPGGDTDVLKNVLGHVFDHEVKIADRVSRKESKPLVAKPRGPAFSGKLFVLIDSESASAAELFARVVQLENRGTVIGDRSLGRVMEARIYPYEQGVDTVRAYEFEVTEADLIMKDGKSLEKNGVVPDETSLPTGADLAAGRDPVLARAVAMAGGKLDAAAAGKLFPYEWAPE